MTRTGTVIVTYNSERVIGPCLDSILPFARVVVVDNNSADSTCDIVRQRPAATLIANSENRGFAAAVNQGFSALDTPFVLLLNPDAQLIAGVCELEQACAGDDTGAATGKLIGQGGSPQTGFHLRRFPTVGSIVFECLGLNRVWPANPVNRRYRYRDLDPSQTSTVEQPSGAFWMIRRIRRDVWQKLRGFDESFHPIWFEDVDFAKRLKEAGYLTVYVPEAVASHQGGHSLITLPLGCRSLWWYGSLLRYAVKHFSRLQVRLICLAVILGSAGRLVTGVVSGLNLRPVLVHGRVMRLAVGCFLTSRIKR
jgi:GT2 family glycosyltransferase